MKFTGFTSTLALAGFAYSAALPIGEDVLGGLVEPVLSTTHRLTGAFKREDFAGLGSTVQTVPSIANTAVGVAAGAVGTGESLASGAVGSVEGAIAQRDEFAGLGSTVQAVPVIVNGAVGTVKGAIAQRDELAGLASTVETVPGIANGAVKIAAGAVGTGESMASNAVYTAEGVAAKASGKGKRELENLAGPIVGSTAAIVGSAVPGVVHEVGTTGKRDIDALSALTSNPKALTGALVELKHAVKIGEITQGQLSKIPALQCVLGLLDL